MKKVPSYHYQTFGKYKLSILKNTQCIYQGRNSRRNQGMCFNEHFSIYQIYLLKFITHYRPGLISMFNWLHTVMHQL